jgi:hydrogenase maturation protease
MSDSIIAPVLILAYGNPSRGDDALAPLWLEQLQTLPEMLPQTFECLTDFQLQIEHALDLQHRQLVLFVDASVAHQQEFEFRQIYAQSEFGYTTHAMNPAAVMQVYHQTIHTSLPACFLLTLQAVEFELGADLTATAARSLYQAINFSRILLKNPTLAFWQSQINAV